MQGDTGGPRILHRSRSTRNPRKCPRPGARPGSAPARRWRQRGWTIPARDAGGASAILVGVEYVSRVPRPPLDRLIDDLYYLEGAPPYARLTLPPMPAAVLIVILGASFRVRAGTDI